jgi:hypothetical protein
MGNQINFYGQFILDEFSLETSKKGIIVGKINTDYQLVRSITMLLN